MINVKYSVLEDGDVNVNANSTSAIYEGTPVALDASGYAEPVKTNIGVYGLSKIDRNSHRDLSYGDAFAGAYGARKITVVVDGIVQIYPSFYERVDNSDVVVQLWAGNLNYYDAVGVDASGFIVVSTSAVGSNTIFGRVLTPPTVANGGVLTIQLY